MSVREGRWRQGSPCWIDVQLDDVDAGRRFYSQLFGWTVEQGPAEAGGYTMALKDGQVVAGLGPKPDGWDMPSVWCTYFAADSADEIHAKVLTAGGQAFMEPFDVMDVGRMFVASDPAGGVFGVWEAKAHNGVELVNEPGAMCWNELHTRDYTAGKDFYAQVFGYRYGEIGNGGDFVYSQITLAEAPDGEFAAGMMDLSTMPDSPEPSNWLAWVAVDDADAAAQKVAELGGTVMMGPHDSPFGRMIIAQGAQGEVLGLIDMSRTAGEPPTVQS